MKIIDKIKFLYHRCKYKYKVFFIKENSYISPNVHFLGRKNILIGKNTVISDNTWFNVNNRSNVEKIFIGDNSYIGKNNFFSSGASISIGSYVMTGINCCFLGADHKIDNPLVPYISTGVTDNKSICLGDNVWLGANVTIVGDVEIGRGSIIGANSLVTKNIPEFSIAIGNPAVVIKRFDFNKNKWKNDYSSLKTFPSSDEYLETLKNSNVIVPKFAAGKSYSDIY